MKRPKLNWLQVLDNWRLYRKSESGRGKRIRLEECEVGKWMYGWQLHILQEVGIVLLIVASIVATNTKKD